MYFIGDIEFFNKKDCVEYVRGYISELGCCVVDINHSAFKFFMDLLRNHENYDDKIRDGVQFFYIEKNKLNKVAYQTGLKTLNGNNVVFSWLHCCELKRTNKVKEQRNNLIKAMRESVSGFIMEFKRNSTLECCECGINDIEAIYHVDHKNPSFKVLSTTYLDTHQTHPTEFASNKLNQVKFRDSDIYFKNEWVAYHNNNCELEILCASCNLRKPKN
jgi:hypothetical protein